MFDLSGVSVRLGRQLALDVDSLHLESGQLVSLIGPNGAGKTTLLRLLAGLISPSTGTVDCAANDVAYVAQRHDVDKWLPVTVEEILRMGRYGRRGLLGRLQPPDRSVISSAARRLRIDDLVGRNFSDLSGGQQQRVRIAAALAREAPCLLLDEPITGLDITSQQVISTVVAEERDRGALVVSSTHRLDEAAQSDRVLVLATQVVADGPPSEALAPDALAAAFGVRVVAVERPASATTEFALIDDHAHPRTDHLR